MHVSGGHLNDLGISGDNLVDAGATPTGSIEFMSPEVASGDHATPWSDLFNVGAALHLVLTGKSVFPAFPHHEILAALRHVSINGPVLSKDRRLLGLLALARECLSARPKVDRCMRWSLRTGSRWRLKWNAPPKHMLDQARRRYDLIHRRDFARSIPGLREISPNRRK